MFSFIKYKNRFIRNILKGSNSIIKDQKFSFEKIRSQLIQINLNNDKRLKFFFLQRYNVDIEKIIKQKLLRQFSWTNGLLNLFLLHSFGNKSNLKFPLPLNWIQVFQNNKIKISRLACIISFYFILIYFLSKSVFKNLIFILKNFFFLITFSYFFFKKIHTHFVNFPTKAIPSHNNQKDNFFFWCIKYFNLFDKKISFSKINFINSIKYTNIFQRSDVGYISNFFLLFKFIYLFIIELFLAISNLLIGKWQRSYLFNDLMEANVIVCSTRSLANKYIFNQGDLFFRPVWTYEIQRKNIDFQLIFYSAGTLDYSLQKHLNKDVFTLITWNNYVFINDFQSEFYNSLNNKIKYKVVGYIPFISSSRELIKNYDITIFDVTPHSNLYNALTLVSDDLFSQKNCINFLKDLESVIFNNNISIVLKLKRVGKYHSRLYVKELTRLSRYTNLDIVKDDYSVEKLIEKSKNIISFPFGTPAIVAKLFGKKSIFYHPGIPIVDLDNRINQDVPIIWGKKNLKLWFNNLSNDK